IYLGWTLQIVIILLAKRMARSIVASSSFEIDESMIGSSSLMILNSCEASGKNSENEPIDQLDQDQLDQESWNQQINQMEKGADEPYVGQIFSSVDEAKRFYNVYAFKTGFSIRKATHYKAKKFDGLVTSTTYTCSKEGHANPSNQKKEVEEASETNRTPKKEFPNRRTGCKALMRLRMIEHEKWIVTTFHKEHNHELIVSPSKTRFFRSHRSITNEQKEVINMLSEQNISTSQIMSFMTAREGGMQNIHFTRKDLKFESGWESMLRKYNLHDINYLQVLWKNRHQWAPVYFRDIFFANMSTSQRSEGMNALLKILLDSHTSIYKFVIQFEKIVASRYENENLQEFKMKDGQASLWTFNPIEEQARDVYTKNVFMDFRDQLKASTGYRITQMENNTYKVCTIQNPSKPYQHMHSYVVSVHEDNEKVSCNCKMFNYAGILCAHALTVMHFVGIHHIPQNYIMKRWTKEAKSGIPSDKTRNVEIVYSSSGRAQWHESLSLIYRKFMNEGTKNLKAYEVAKKDMELILSKLTSLNKELESVEASKNDKAFEQHGTTISQSSYIKVGLECQAANVDLEGQVGQVVKDPPQSQCKGKRRPERIKPHAAKVKKSRTCAKCKRKGHNIRTCKEEPIHEDFDGGSSTERDGSVDVNVVVVITVKTVVVLNNWVNVAIVVTFETIVVVNIATELEFWVNVAIVVAFETIVVLNVAIVVTFETIVVVNVAVELENWGEGRHLSEGGGRSMDEGGFLGRAAEVVVVVVVDLVGGAN
ncbi:Protein FAR1-RELATED SEQUENCE 5, partial [Ananas comosus]